MKKDSKIVRIAFGDNGLEIEVPLSAVVVEPRVEPAVLSEKAELFRALTEPVAGPPLRDRLRRGAKVAIAICDATRPQPRQAMVSAILEQLAGIVPDHDVTVLVATGTHRGSTEAELKSMLGSELLGRIKVIDHDARDQRTLVWKGVLGDGVPVWLNRRWVEADVRITTGFVEPHFFAGFSGAPKLVAPGLAGLETVLTLHDARRIGSSLATWGICVGNPVHDDVRAIAEATGVDFALDVILNTDKRIVAAFGGDLLAMHEVAREAAKQIAMVEVPGLFDVVVTTNSGYPLDQNLYQAVKGMSAAATVVKPGGVIICAAECRDGFPDHGSFREVLASASSPEELLELISDRDTTVPDQWQVQVLARVLTTARVLVHTPFIDEAALAAAHLGYAPDISVAVAEACAEAGPGSTVCVLPEGPQTIPYVHDEKVR